MTLPDLVEDRGRRGHRGVGVGEHGEGVVRTSTSSHASSATERLDATTSATIADEETRSLASGRTTECAARPVRRRA